jgi:hypothetical protein
MMNAEALRRLRYLVIQLRKQGVARRESLGRELKLLVQAVQVPDLEQPSPFEEHLQRFVQPVVQAQAVVGPLMFRGAV